jgi:hypothetical protein
MSPVGKSDSFRARAQHPAGAARNNGTKVEGTAGQQGTGRRLPGFGRCRVSSDRLIFFDCFSKQAHLRRPGQLIRSTRGADQGSVDRQDHGRESCVSRRARPVRLLAELCPRACARARVDGGEVLGPVTASLYAKGEVASTHRVDGSDRPSTQGLLRSDRGHRRYQHEEFRA